MQTLDLTGLTNNDGDNPTDAVQYAVIDRDGASQINGDQEWVRSHQCITEGSRPGGRIQYRRVTITYGPWIDCDSEDCPCDRRAR